MSKNIAIFCDGTGYEMGEQLSTIAKLFRSTKNIPDRQIALYHAGIGEGVRQDEWVAIPQKLRKLFNEATGHGLYDHVIECYNKIRAHYEPGDRLFLLGSSRDAYAMRVLAGFIGLVGILPKDAFDGRVNNAFNTYRSISMTDRTAAALRLRHNEGSRDAPIDFVGAFDTVASYFIPRIGEEAHYDALPWSLGNPRIGKFRHVMALDERRADFRLKRWDEASARDESAVASETRAGQDIDEIWVPGTHIDVLGGNPEAENGLSKIGALWMARELQKAGLDMDEELIGHLILGQSNGGKHDYVGPDPAAPLHETLAGAWLLREVWPKRIAEQEWPRPRILPGRYLPLAEPRQVREGDHANSAVMERMRLLSDYRPVNLRPENIASLAKARAAGL